MELFYWHAFLQCFFFVLLAGRGDREVVAMKAQEVEHFLQLLLCHYAQQVPKTLHGRVIHEFSALTR